MDELKNVTTVQKLVEKTSNSRSNYHAPMGHTTSHVTENLSVNVVSSTKEKQEIYRVLDVAKKKIKLCHEQVETKYTKLKIHQNACQAFLTIFNAEPF